MKKILSVILALCLAALCAVPALAAPVQVPSALAGAGKSFTVTVSLDAPVQNVINATVVLTFDASVAEATQVAAGSVFEGFLMQSATNEGRASYGGTASAGADLAAGTVCTFTLRMKKAGDPALDLTSAFTCDAAEGSTVLPTVNVSLSTKVEEQGAAATAGDVDGNGKIDSNDAIYLLYHIFFPESYAVTQDCDFDGSGKVDSNDAIYLLYHIFFPEQYPLAEKENTGSFNVGNDPGGSQYGPFIPFH